MILTRPYLTPINPHFEQNPFRLKLCFLLTLHLQLVLCNNYECRQSDLRQLTFIMALWVVKFQLLTHPGSCSPKKTHLTLCNMTQASSPAMEQDLYQIMLKNDGPIWKRWAAFEFDVNRFYLKYLLHCVIRYVLHQCLCNLKHTFAVGQVSYAHDTERVSIWEKPCLN